MKREFGLWQPSKSLRIGGALGQIGSLARTKPPKAVFGRRTEDFPEVHGALSFLEQLR
jgi:hypothetical protein